MIDEIDRARIASRALLISIPEMLKYQTSISVRQTHHLGAKKTIR
jgi:hypothetical protein